MDDINSILDRIKKLGTSDIKGAFGLFASAAEELGELGRAMLIEDGMKNAVLLEPSKAEAIDTAIAAISIFYVRGGTNSEMLEIFKRKLDKWEFNEKERESQQSSS